MAITHSFVSPKSDGADATLVRPSNWNADHAGTLDHGTGLTGLTDDDHTQYLKEEASGGAASEVPDHTHASAAEAGGTVSPATLNLPATASPAQTSDGQAVWDSDDDVLTIGDGASRKEFGYHGSTSPSTQAFGDAAAAGTSKEDARIDHKHAMPADPVTAHAAAGDPHTGYRLESADHTHQSAGAQAGKLDHGLALDGLTDDDHTQYQLESEKGAASGYAGLDTGTKVPTAQLGGAGADGTKFLRGDQSWAVPSGGGAPTDADYLVGTANGSLSAEIVVGTTPGGELGGTWASPTVDATHSGSAHHAQSHDHSVAGDGTTLTPATLNLPAAASPAQTADGQAVWDSDDNLLTVGDGASRQTFLPVNDATSDPAAVHSSTPSDGTEATLARKDHVHAHGTHTTDLHTNYMQEALADAKGDIFTATAADTPAVLTVGANDTILMADSATGTGLKWAAAATTAEIADISTTEAAGTSDTYARGDHVHAHGTHSTDLHTNYLQESWVLSGRTTSDQAWTSNNTLANVTGMVFAIAASEVWMFDFYIFANGANTGDLKLAIDVPAGATLAAGEFGAMGAAATSLVNADQHGIYTVDATALAVAIGLAGTGNPNLIHMHGIVVNSTNAGNVQLMAAQFTSDATATTVMANSHYLGTRIA